MKKFLFTTCILGALVTTALPESGFSVNWNSNYEEAVSQSKSQSKPIVVFFTGSDWCGWCKKLESEALSNPEFDEKTKDKFVFLMVDFPRKSSQSPEVKKQNSALMNKYNVKGFPSLIILDSQQKQIAQTGYKPGGGSSYADHLLQISNQG